MGKTLGAILTIGAAVALNFIPGAGSFLSQGLISTLGQGLANLGVYATTAASIASTLATGLTLGVTALGIQSVGGLLGGGGFRIEGMETAIKKARPERVSAYGRKRHYCSWLAQ